MSCAKRKIAVIKVLFSKTIRKSSTDLFWIDDSYREPMAKKIMRPSFCRDGICNLKIIGIGMRSRTKSEAIPKAAVAM